MAVNRVYQMDCLAGLHQLAGQVSVIVTSPPYNIGTRYRSYDDSRPNGEYLAWMREVASACRKALADNGSLFLNVGGKPSDPITPLKVAQEFLLDSSVEGGLLLQNTIIWVKSIAIPKDDVPKSRTPPDDLTFGHYQPVNGPAYLNGCFEYIFHFSKSGRNELDRHAVGVTYQDKSNVERWCGEDLRDRGNTWFIPYETISQARPHPATFPSKLPEMCIRLHGRERVKLVVDPFMGVGSTALAALRAHVPFIGFEIDPEYVALAREQIRLARDDSAQVKTANSSSPTARKLSTTGVTRENH